MMEVITQNAEQALARIASCIGQSARAWQDWTALHISAGTQDASLPFESVRAVLQSYMQDTEGKVYLCDRTASVHLIGRNIPARVLKQAAQHVCAILDDSGLSGITHKLYDLGEDGQDYADMVLAAYDTLATPQDNTESPVNPCALEQRYSHKNTDPAHNTGKIQHDKKVLLVEDDPVTRWMVRTSLKNECELVTAPNANQAFAKLQAFRPDVVFLDINLPDKSGCDVLEWIVRQDPGAKVIMFSSQNDLEHISDTLEQGAAGFIAKPFMKEDLVSYIS